MKPQYFIVKKLTEEVRFDDYDQFCDYVFKYSSPDRPMYDYCEIVQTIEDLDTFYKAVILDETGLPIPFWWLKNAAHEYHARNPRRTRFRLFSHIKHDFRVDPVPRTGTRRRGRMFRRPKTTQERRKYVEDRYNEDYQEYGVKLRGRRSKAMLPESWDDIFINRSRCWKDHRKKQWK